MRGARKDALNDADLVILCLPDEAAREAVALIDNPKVRVIDASTAHRVADGWVYGFAELEPDGYQAIAAAKRVANPGCWATGFLALARPLVAAGLVPADFPLTVHGVSGYSGGGKSMIEEFEKKDSPVFVETVQRGYALGLGHKHIPEMTRHAGLSHPPLFAPSVARFYRGMLVEVAAATLGAAGQAIGARSACGAGGGLSRPAAGRGRQPGRSGRLPDPGCRTDGRQQPHEAVCFRQ